MINLDIQNRIATLQLARPKVNAINLEMVEQLNHHLSQLRTDNSIRGIILTGSQGIFSGGLDVLDLYPRTSDYMTKFWQDFTNLLLTLFSYPKPIISAISGHSPAGGTVMAIMTDYRIMADGEYTIGLNEVAVGLILPESICRVYQYLLGNRQAELLASTGTLVNPEKALDLGLIDEICAPFKLLDRSVEVMEQWLRLPSAQMSHTKQQLRAETVRYLKACQPTDIEQMTRIWFEPEFRKVMGELVKMLGGNG